MKRDSHLIVSPVPIPEGSPAEAQCGKEIQATLYESGDVDVRLTDVLTLVSCRKCKSEQKSGRYFYAAIEAQEIR